MARSWRIRRFQVKSDRLEKKKLQIEKEKLESSHDFSETTLAITLLAGVSAFLLKLIDYFNNNIITISNYLQVTAYFLVCLLLLELSMIFLFLILKGYLISTKYKVEKIKYMAQDLFKYIFIIPILWIVISIPTFFFDQFFKDPSVTTFYGYLIFTYLIVIWIFVRLAYEKDLIESLENILKKKSQIKIKSLFKNLHFNSRHYLIINFIILIIPLIIFLMLLILIAPSYLLMGSFSIEDITQSNTNSDILTFTIKETGFPYNSIYITLNKFNSEGNFMQYVHYVKINRTIEAHSNNSFMLGGNYNGIWYLNVNTSNLQPGNYLLHAELTIDALKSFTIFGSSKKYADKLFYIAPNSTKCFLDSTQELNNSSRSPSI